MEENTKGNKIYIIITIVALLLLSIVSIYLVFFNGPKEVKGKTLELYKYELYNGDIKYFTEKLDANKIELSDTLSYSCEKDDCSFLKSLYANGNISDSYVAIKDGKKYVLYEYSNYNKRIIDLESNIDYVQFISDNYLLFIDDNNYYAYNIKDNTISNKFKSDILVTNDDKVKVVLNENIITVDNGKYGLVNLNTGNSLYDNEYTNIKCNKKSCLLSYEDKDNLYVYHDDKTSLVAQDINNVLYYDDNYCIYEDSKTNEVVLYDTNKNDSNLIKKFDKSNTINGLEVNDDKYSLNVEKNNVCNKITYSEDKVTTETIKCVSNKLRTDIYVSSYNKAYITVKHENSENQVYDLKINDGGTLYDNTGVFYDILTLRKDNTTKPELKGVVVKNTAAYEFLDKYATKLNLKPLEKNYFINRFMNKLQENNTSLVNIEVFDENKTYDGVTIISNVDNYRYVRVTINKVDDNYKSTTEEIKIPEVERKGLSVVLVSGLE